MDQRFFLFSYRRMCRRALLAIALCSVTASASAIIMIINTTAKTITLSGNDLYVDLTADTEFPYWLRFRTNTNTTGLYGGGYIPRDTVSVDGVGNIVDNGAIESQINVKSNGKVLDLYLAFPTSEESLKGYLITESSISYASWGLLSSYIGDGSSLDGKVLSPFMPNPELTFPFDEDPSIPIMVVVPEAKHAALALGLLALSAGVALSRYRHA